MIKWITSQRRLSSKRFISWFLLISWFLITCFFATNFQYLRLNFVSYQESSRILQFSIQEYAIVMFNQYFHLLRIELKFKIKSFSPSQWKSTFSSTWISPLLLPIVLLWWCIILGISIFMMTSSNGNIFRVTGPLCGEFTGHRWIPLTKPSDAELWCFLWSAPWINGSVNNCEACDLRRHWTHCDVIVMCYFWPFIHDIFPDYVITPVSINLLWSIWMMHVPSHIQAQ